MAAVPGSRDTGVVTELMRLGRTDNRIGIASDLCGKGYLLIPGHAHRTDNRRHMWAGIFRSVQPLQLLQLLIDRPY